MGTHVHYMKKCIALGEEAMQNGNPPVGSILVKDDAIIGIGREAVKSGNDITKHAEIEAIRYASTHGLSIKESILYTTHEPCIMCSYVIRHHQIKTLVFGVKSEYVGGSSSEFKILKTENVPNWKETPEIIEGVLKNECINLSRAYQKRT
ncbi:MAG: nucleoside deaminase [Maribacter sp.]|nr:nucleoside deaminase [Maribacter sp.]